MQFLVDYTVAIDVIALVAIAALAITAMVRRGSAAMGLFAIVAVLWVAVRLFQIV